MELILLSASLGGVDMTSVAWQSSNITWCFEWSCSNILAVSAEVLVPRRVSDTFWRKPNTSHTTTEQMQNLCSRILDAECPRPTLTFDTIKVGCLLDPILQVGFDWDIMLLETQLPLRQPGGWSKVDQFDNLVVTFVPALTHSSMSTRSIRCCVPCNGCGRTRPLRLRSQLPTSTAHYHDRHQVLRRICNTLLLGPCRSAIRGFQAAKSHRTCLCSWHWLTQGPAEQTAY